MERKQFYLTTVRGLFYYTLWENSNFLGNNPRNWYLFARDRASVFYSANEAQEHKLNLLTRIAKQGNDYINNHLIKNNFPAEHIENHKQKINKVITTFSKLQITEKVMQLN